MSAKDKENKTFQEKLKQFFRINKGGAGTSTLSLLRGFFKNCFFLFSCFRLSKIGSIIIHILGPTLGTRNVTFKEITYEYLFCIP